VPCCSRVAPQLVRVQAKPFGSLESRFKSTRQWSAEVRLVAGGAEIADQGAASTMMVWVEVELFPYPAGMAGALRGRPRGLGADAVG
jgi:hypothetical protein